MTPDRTCILDPEFAFYGPVGYDTGNFIANMIFAYDNGLSTDDTEFCEWCLKTIGESIDAYERGDVFIFGAGNDNTDMQTKESSEQYDKMVSQKLSVTADLAETERSISYYEERLRILKQNTVGGTNKEKVVKEDLEKASKKINKLVELVNETADDYYENISLSNAFNVLVPASFEAVSTIKSGIVGAIVPILGLEALLFVVYMIVVFVQAIKEDYLKRQAAAKQSDAAADTDAEKASDSDKE